MLKRDVGVVGWDAKPAKHFKYILGLLGVEI